MERVVIFLMGVVVGFIATRWYCSAIIKSLKKGDGAGGTGTERNEKKDHSEQSEIL